MPGAQAGTNDSSDRPSTNRPGQRPSPCRISRSTSSRLKSVGSLVPSSRTSRFGSASRKRLRRGRSHLFDSVGVARITSVVTDRKPRIVPVASEMRSISLGDHREVTLARFGQDDAPSGLGEERHPELQLERLDLLRHRRRGDAQFLGSLGDAPELRGSMEHPDCANRKLHETEDRGGLSASTSRASKAIDPRQPFPAAPFVAPHATAREPSRRSRQTSAPAGRRADRRAGWCRTSFAQDRRCRPSGAKAAQCPRPSRHDVRGRIRRASPRRSAPPQVSASPPPTRPGLRRCGRSASRSGSSTICVSGNDPASARAMSICGQ